MIGVLVALGLVCVAWLVLRRLVRIEQSGANEWLVVMRNGKLMRSGVGISHFVSVGDQVAKFPSRLNRVGFDATQVTREMQGVGVRGVIIWTINREGDGPQKAYRSFGSDLCDKDPKSANDKLKEMSSAIVRARIANSSVNEVMTKRDLLRNEIKKELNALVAGWGVWLETVEITDV